MVTLTILDHFPTLCAVIDTGSFETYLLRKKLITEDQLDEFKKRNDKSYIACHLLLLAMESGSPEEFCGVLRENKVDEDTINKIHEPAVEGAAAVQSPPPTAPAKTPQQILDTMHNTMLHDPNCNGWERYPPETHGVFTVNGLQQSDILTNVPKNIHMEVLAIMALMRKIRSGELKGPEFKLVLYSNWSPCPTCVKCILGFLHWSKRMNLQIILTVRVVALYRILWPACEEKKCGHVQFSRNSEYNREDYRAGIKDLIRGGVSMEAFDEDSWMVIMDALGIPQALHLNGKARLHTDLMMMRSLKVMKDDVMAEYFSNLTL